MSTLFAIYQVFHLQIYRCIVLKETKRSSASTKSKSQDKTRWMYTKLSVLKQRQGRLDIVKYERGSLCHSFACSTNLSRSCPSVRMVLQILNVSRNELDDPKIFVMFPDAISSFFAENFWHHLGTVIGNDGAVVSIQMELQNYWLPKRLLENIGIQTRHNTYESYCFAGLQPFRKRNCQQTSFGQEKNSFLRPGFHISSELSSVIS